MKKINFLLVMFMLLSGSVFAESINILLVPDNPNGPDKEGSRSINAFPSASLNESTLTVNFPVYTTSQVVVRDAETGAVVYSASYDATRQVAVNLSSLPEGTYELHVYAFGKWWWGEFEIEEDY